MRQYIGARYVPTFADPITWDGSHSYEALIMVDYMGDTYTSKKPVPPNISISNTDYWVKTGSFNSQLNLISERVDDLETEMDTIIDNYAVFNKVIIIGDSYMTRNTQKLGVDLAAYLGITASDYFISAEGACGFANPNPTGHRFIDCLQAANNHFNNDEVSHIIVLGGANDTQETDDDVYTYYQAFVAYAHTNFPNAKILVGFVGATDTQADIPEYARMCRCYRNMCITTDYSRYLYNVEYFLHNKYYLEADHVHPTVTATKLMAYKCAEAVVFGSCHINYNWNITTDTVWNDIYIDLTDNVVRMCSKLRGANITYGADDRPTWSPGMSLKLTTLSNLRITGSVNNLSAMAASCEVFYNNGTDSKTIPCTIALFGDEIYITNCGYSTLADVNLITLPALNMTFNTLDV